MQAVLYAGAGLISLLVFYYLGEYQSFISENIFKGIGLVVFLFFVIIAGTFAKHLKSNEAGLMLTHDGLFDNTSTISVGLIPWKDITSFEQLPGKELKVNVRNAEKYLTQAKNSAVRRLLEQNINLYQTPIIIKWSSLALNNMNIKEQCEVFHGRYGKKVKK